MVLCHIASPITEKLSETSLDILNKSQKKKKSQRQQAYVNYLVKGSFLQVLSGFAMVELLVRVCLYPLCVYFLKLNCMPLW